MTKKEETVKIRLFKDNNEYKDPLFVAVNGRSFTVPRGVEVEVPVCVAKAIARSEHQDAMAMQMMEELQKHADWDKDK